MGWCQQVDQNVEPEKDLCLDPPDPDKPVKCVGTQCPAYEMSEEEAYWEKADIEYDRMRDEQMMEAYDRQREAEAAEEGASANPDFKEEL